MKRIRLHKSTLSNEDLTAIAEQTLTNGGYKGPRIGDTMSDGTIYAGISPETGKPIYTTPADAPDFITFDMEQAAVQHRLKHASQAVQLEGVSRRTQPGSHGRRPSLGR